MMQARRKRPRGDIRVGGYSNDENPFGDSNLSERFVWRKNARGGGELVDEDGNPRGETEEERERRLAKAEEELQRARERRDERELEKRSREEEAHRVARDKQNMEAADWIKVEDLFNAKQYYAKQAILIRQRRPRSIDILAKNTRLDMLDVPDDSVPVFAHIANLPDEQLVDLLGQMKDECAHAEALLLDEGLMDVDCVFLRKKVEWFEHLADLANHELGGSYRHINPAIDDEMDALLKDKDPLALRELEEEIQGQINSGAIVDVEYWGMLLRKIRSHATKANLRHLQVDFLVEKEERRARAASDDVSVVFNPASVGGASQGEGHLEEDNDRRGRINKLEEDADDEEPLVDELILARSENYAWNDKYRPRKPKYYNRVHTAYEWNKYNQTHYDHDNPPPKTVQGYKFNIFYPDLIDKTKAPTFKITKTENPDVAIIRFSAGPPYEDIAFKIVNRDWELSHKKGYRCSFERGILHLWFNFRRLRYRR